jgi:hypothetical protein
MATNFRANDKSMLKFAIRGMIECAYLIWPHRDYLFWPHSASGIGGVRVN